MVYQGARSGHIFYFGTTTEKVNNAAIFFPRPLLLVTLEIEEYL